MTTTKLTTKKIKALVYEGQVSTRRGRKVETRDVRWDTDVPGLGIRVYPSGSKHFVFSYRVKGRKRLMTLGRFGADLTLDQARRRARKRRVEAQDGTDPLEEKRKTARGKTLGDLIETYIETYAKPRKKTWKADQQRLARHIPAAWKSRDVRAIAQWEVAKLHQTIGEHKPYEANRLIEILRRMYNIAPTLIAVDAALENPIKGVTKFREQKRKRWARPEELPALAQAIDREPNIYMRAAIWLYLLTGARKSELLAARRAAIDWTQGRLRLPDTKSGEEQSITLSAPALAILQALPQIEGNPYAFPGIKRGRHLVNIDKAWQRVRAEATISLWADHDDRRVSGLIKKLARAAKTRRRPGRPSFAPDIKAAQSDRKLRIEEVRSAAKRERLELPTGLMDLRVHDLRRTLGSWFTQAGVDLNVVKEGLRHADLGTTLTYARLGADPARVAFEQHGRRILEAAGKRGPVVVVGGEHKD